MTVRAHAPGSVTTVFVPQDDGSLGVSFATEDGVTARVTPADETTVTLNDERTEFEPVSGVLRDLGVTARVELDAEIPVGRGFGASGAATLSTALAANEAFDLGLTREDCVDAAHRAEVAAGTGLGDVFVQDLGGLAWNTGDGRNRVERTDRIEYASFGDIATADVLGDDEAMARITDAGPEALAGFDPDASLAEWFRKSWSFAERVGLEDDAVTDAVADVRSAGGGATMAMVGATVVAAGVEDVLPNATRISPDGARVLSR